MPYHSGTETLMPSGPSETVTVIGAVHLDIKGTSEGQLVPGTSNPGRVGLSPGGVGRNIAENLARLGIRTSLLGAVGRDRFGLLVRERTAEAGVDVSDLLETDEQPTGVYVFLTDSRHESFAAVSDTRTTDLVTPEYLRKHEEKIAESGILVLDTNLPGETITEAAALAEMHGVPVILEPVSVRKAEKLLGLGLRLSAITPNALEYQALSGHNPDPEKPNVLPWAERVFVTLGAGGVLVLKYPPEKNSLYSSLPAVVVDETGAGDAFTAGLTAGLLYGYSEERAVETGIGAAVLTLESPWSVCPDLSMKRIAEIRKERR